MKLKKLIDLVNVHCEGEVGKVVTGGVLGLPGATIGDKLRHLNEVDDRLRLFLTREPRAHLAMSVNLLLPPTVPEADVGMLVLQSDKTHAMSGSNAICVVTALLELGHIPVRGEHTQVVLDTAAGLVRADAHCVDGSCQSVSLDMPESFVEALDYRLAVPGIGEVRLDIAFGGVFYGLVDVEPLGLHIRKDRARDLATVGNAILGALRSAIDPVHPLYKDVHGVAYVTFRHDAGNGEVHTCTVLPPGRVDRSPCGTGSSAHMATLYARGRIGRGDEFVSRSITGGRFRMTCVDVGTHDGRTFVKPKVTGRAWIYGFEKIALDSGDPLAEGFTVNDVWGVGEWPVSLGT